MTDAKISVKELARINTYRQFRMDTKNGVLKMVAIEESHLAALLELANASKYTHTMWRRNGARRAYERLTAAIAPFVDFEEEEAT